MVTHGDGVAEPAVDVGHQHVGHGHNGGLLEAADVAHQLLVSKGLGVSLS